MPTLCQTVDQDLFTLIWLGLGVVLILGEVMIPGLISVFLGAAAVLVAGLRWTGLVESFAVSLFAWMGLSVGLIITLRGWVQRYLPAETSWGQASEQLQAIGSMVEVIEEVNEDDNTGRIRYQGTSWPATAVQGRIPKGAQAKLIARDNLAWVVEPIEALPPAETTALEELDTSSKRKKTGG